MEKVRMAQQANRIKSELDEIVDDALTNRNNRYRIPDREKKPAELSKDAAYWQQVSTKNL